MLRSMTAFGRKVTVIKGGELIWELRCVNQRFLEQVIRLPEEFRILELQVREHIAAHLRRGKVECYLRWRSSEKFAEISLNNFLVEQLIKATHQVENLLFSSAPISPLEILRWHGIVQNQELDINSVQQDIINALEAMLNDVLEQREREGLRIAHLINERLVNMEEVLEKVKKRLPEILTKQRGRLINKINELQTTFDHERLEQEMLFFIQKVDIEEELDRLSGHIFEVRRIIEKEENAGRRLDFLMQELNRETNTLGSKSVDLEVTKCAIDLKVFIEQMREQIQNVE